MASSSESDNEVEDTNEIATPVALLADHKVLLAKSQVPKIKQKKVEALAAITKDLAVNLGTTVDGAKVMKKISYLKARVKKKSDANKTGNRHIKLLPWESTFLKLLNVEENPIFTKVPGKED